MQICGHFYLCTKSDGRRVDLHVIQFHPRLSVCGAKFHFLSLVGVYMASSASQHNSSPV
jgi:hypothetical protein